MKKEEYEDGQFLGNFECICGQSSDAMSVYRKSDDTTDAYCRSGFCCRDSGYIPQQELEEEGFLVDGKLQFKCVENKPVQTDFSEIESLPIRGWKERKITKKTCEKYGVRSRMDDDDEIVARYYPSTVDDKAVGYLQRTLPKTFVGIGNTKATNQFFGQSVFQSGQKYLVITTGQEDAMAFAQALHQDKGDVEYWTPCISVQGGDGSSIKQTKANFEYVNSFEKVILAFDNDESGKAQIEAVARLLSPGKAYIAKLPNGIKDACDLLKEGRSSDLKQVFWKAEPFSRVDVLHLSQMWDDFENEDNNAKIPFPDSWAHLNEMMNGGGEKGEITVIGALTSAGKSTIINNIVYHLIENTRFKVGAMYLEGTKREVVRDLLSLDAGVNLRKIDRSTFDVGKLKDRFFTNLAKRDQFVYVDHQGSISTDEIFDKLNYLAKAESCDVIIIDPIQAGVNSSDNSAIINFMDTLLKFAKETDTYVIAVSHMRKPDSDDPHNVSEYSLLGSSSIVQISFNTILVSRDKMSPDPIIRNATKLRLVKCRRTGETGDAGWLRYDDETTHMFATSDPYLDNLGNMDDEFLGIPEEKQEREAVTETF